MTHFNDLPQDIKIQYEAGDWIKVTEESVINDVSVELLYSRPDTLTHIRTFGYWRDWNKLWSYGGGCCSASLDGITHYKKLSPTPNDTKAEAETAWNCESLPVCNDWGLSQVLEVQVSDMLPTGFNYPLPGYYQAVYFENYGFWMLLAKRDNKGNILHNYQSETIEGDGIITWKELQIPWDGKKSYQKLKNIKITPEDLEIDGWRGDYCWHGTNIWYYKTINGNKDKLTVLFEDGNISVALVEVSPFKESVFEGILEMAQLKALYDYLWDGIEIESELLTVNYDNFKKAKKVYFEKVNIKDKNNE